MITIIPYPLLLNPNVFFTGSTYNHPLDNLRPAWVAWPGDCQGIR
jgi:hypothetical protein